MYYENFANGVYNDDSDVTAYGHFGFFPISLVSFKDIPGESFLRHPERHVTLTESVHLTICCRVARKGSAEAKNPQVPILPSFCATSHVLSLYCSEYPSANTAREAQEDYYSRTLRTVRLYCATMQLSSLTFVCTVETGSLLNCDSN